MEYVSNPALHVFRVCLSSRLPPSKNWTTASLVGYLPVRSKQLHPGNSSGANSIIACYSSLEESLQPSVLEAMLNGVTIRIQCLWHFTQWL